MPDAEKVTEDLYEFSDWRGQKYECVRGERDESNQAREQERMMIAMATVGPSPFVVPAFGFRWHVYSGVEYFGSYVSPYDAAKVFAQKVVLASGLLS